MTNTDLENKFSGLTNSVIGEAKTTELIAACWDLKKISLI
jgi:hypothetical protein